MDTPKYYNKSHSSFDKKFSSAHRNDKRTVKIEFQTSAPRVISQSLGSYKHRKHDNDLNIQGVDQFTSSAWTASFIAILLRLPRACVLSFISFLEDAAKHAKRYAHVYTLPSHRYSTFGYPHTLGPLCRYFCVAPSRTPN